MLLIGWTTTSTREQADMLAELLVSSGHVTCAQVDGPITSIYRWEGKVERNEEFRLTLKFGEPALPGVEAALHDHHPYDTPEWIVVKADRVAEKYLSWTMANSSSLPFNASQAPL